MLNKEKLFFLLGSAVRWWLWIAAWVFYLCAVVNGLWCLITGWSPCLGCKPITGPQRELWKEANSFHLALRTPVMTELYKIYKSINVILSLNASAKLKPFFQIELLFNLHKTLWSIGQWPGWKMIILDLQFWNNLSNGSEIKYLPSLWNFTFN